MTTKVSIENTHTKIRVTICEPAGGDGSKTCTPMDLKPSPQPTVLYVWGARKLCIEEVPGDQS